MHTNLTKAQAFPLALKISSEPRCFKSSHTINTQCLPFFSAPKPSLSYSTELRYGTLEMGKLASPMHVSYGLLQKVARRYCLSLRTRKQLPWLVSNEVKEAQGLGKAKVTNIRSSIQEESAKKVSYKSSWEESMQRLEKVAVPASGHSSLQASAATYSKHGDTSAAATRESRNELNNIVGEQRNYYGGRQGKFDEDDEGGDDEIDEAIDDPRWDNIKSRFKRREGERAGSERPEFRKWNKQENWGKKTWKEATQSTVPKIVGEGVYGVGPVLAALSAGRREFYALYVQEGLDLSSNNRKKKDKRGFEKVLKIAEKVGLSVKEASKHDLNMVVDNRPHQGLVLDASPLEMVKIKELDPMSIEEGRGSLWIALDEVTDPQNLGAIIRSSYYFGASGIVLCAKNSAPLSGVVSKASAGSLELMEIRYCKNMMQFLVSSSENGWRVLGGSVSSKAVSLDEIVPGPPTILVLGSEGTGLRPLVEKSCTDLVRIPGNIPADITTSELDGETTGLSSEISGKEFQSFLAVESLNVSVAAGVLLHHLIGKKSEESLPDGYRQTDALE
ncbi:rRNA methyltransferase 1, mitochondrial [Senna tora]|uniref:rRNA methyltransferase 1, mitochondrial n=1 Tax=Senna tora TaxID=362788 RepID=A0A834TEZ6_9FABA|nr:rRNA methyltransferase 1, mitochondrial [Senna tora]